MRISDWSSDVCSSDLREAHRIGAVSVDQLQRIDRIALGLGHLLALGVADQPMAVDRLERRLPHEMNALHHHPRDPEEDDVEPGDEDGCGVIACQFACGVAARSEAHTSELQSLMRISYAVFCLK